MQILQSISAKLPSYSGVKWCRFAHEAQVKDKKLVGSKDFTNFVKQEAELANNPVFSPDVLKRERKKNGSARDNNGLLKPKPQGGSEPSQSFTTSASLVNGSKQKQQPPTRGRPPPCPICEDKHFIAKCATFNRATADERFEMLTKLHLCFSCFKTNHVSSECRCRSRSTKISQEPVAFCCHIEGMFHQVRVNKEHRDLLRFLWWPNGDTAKEPLQYRMTVHLFGAMSCPGCANFALKSTADDHEAEFGMAAANFLKNDFYVDIGLKSVGTVQEAVKLIKNTKVMCDKGGFNHTCLCQTAKWC